ncbi:acetyltransferase [Furfurilactobacillus rossiae]|uniref:acyltransferase family protein n=1 Tax=Furfurilactobacillus rossiae TaxID=231049 RepID=UPI0015BB1638|nr:acyltransferase family protein [Furfurilactobacillus rossiae]MCF6165364.1 acyltransferase family protein [Furfurilactobacillus rossiae]QLE63724.1 acetyltransferase [Furfurilactobacillus rossiae]
MSEGIVKKKRVAWVDIARGIAILAVILGHSIFDVKLNYNSYVAHVIFAFHMPIFFIVSGYFYREKTLKTELKGGLCNLILPYLMTAVFAFIAVIVGMIWQHNPVMYSSMSIPQFLLAVLYGFGGGPAHSAGIPAIGATWFLMAMFVAIQVFNWSMRLTNKSNSLLRLALFLTYAVMGIAINQVVFLPWATNSALLVQPFLYGGYLLKKSELAENIKWPVLVISLLLWLYSAHISFLQLSAASMPYYLEQFMGAFGGSMIVFWISQKIEKHSRILTNIFKKYGSQSIVVFCFHAFDLSYVSLIALLDVYVYPVVKNQYLFLIIVYAYRLLIPTVMMLLMPYIKGLRSFYLNRNFPFRFQVKNEKNLIKQGDQK